MLEITLSVTLPDDEIELHAIRAQGAGGQNVNKVSSAIHLRFDIRASSLPDIYKERLLRTRDRRISAEGVIIIKAQQHRSQGKNRADALKRLQEIIRAAVAMPKKRKPTRQSLASKKRLLEHKTRRGQLKSLRKKVIE